MREKLDIKWSEYLGDEEVDVMWDCFVTKIKGIMEECVPSRVFMEGRERRLSRNGGLPLNKKLRAKVKRKQRLWERLRKLAAENNSDDRGPVYQAVQCE